MLEDSRAGFYYYLSSSLRVREKIPFLLVFQNFILNPKESPFFHERRTGKSDIYLRASKIGLSKKKTVSYVIQFELVCWLAGSEQNMS